MESLHLIKSFTNLIYFDKTSVSAKSVGYIQECYFRYYRCPEQLTFKKMKWFWKLFCCRYLVPMWDRYVQQIDRAMKTFYNFFNFNILGIVQFKFNSPIVLLHILSQSTCLNRLISIEYNNIVCIRQMHILVNSRKTLFPNKCWFFFPKRFKGHSQFRSFPLVYLIENHFLQNLEVSNVRPTNFLIL